jgi:hypothetical protein
MNRRSSASRRERFIGTAEVPNRPVQRYESLCTKADSRGFKGSSVLVVASISFCLDCFSHTQSTRHTVTHIGSHMNLRAVRKDESMNFSARRIEQGGNSAAGLHRMH